MEVSNVLLLPRFDVSSSPTGTKNGFGGIQWLNIQGFMVLSRNSRRLWRVKHRFYNAVNETRH